LSANNYLNLYLDAGIANRQDQESYSRRLDIVLAQEAITVADIVGLGENGTGSSFDLYVVHRHAITLACEKGLFNKRIEVERVCPIASIVRLRDTQEGFKGTELTITAHDAEGKVVAKIVWSLAGPDWVEPLVLRQREHLFKVISQAMDRLGEAVTRPSVATASSKAAAIMEWASDVVKAAGVEVTTEVVEEHANMIAAVMRMFVFLRLGAPYGIDDLNKFYPSGEMPPGPPISTFDDLYGHVVARVGSTQLVDQEIDSYLAGSWVEYVNGCRETYALRT
jgi:hypothetical protein